MLISSNQSTPACGFQAEVTFRPGKVAFNNTNPFKKNRL
jgi:hypothetical protein